MMSQLHVAVTSWTQRMHSLNACGHSITLSQAYFWDLYFFQISILLLRKKPSNLLKRPSNAALQTQVLKIIPNDDVIF